MKMRKKIKFPQRGIVFFYILIQLAFPTIILSMTVANSSESIDSSVLYRNVENPFNPVLRNDVFLPDLGILSNDSTSPNSDDDPAFLIPVGANQNLSNPYISEYGFYLEFAPDQTIFHDFPFWMFTIVNETAVQSQNYQYSFSNQTHHSIWYDITISVVEDQIIWGGLFHAWWNGNSDSHALSLHFTAELSENDYDIIIIKDYIAPSFQFGLKLDETGEIVELNDNPRPISTKPTLYLDFYDNINYNQTGFLKYTLFNQEYQTDILLISQVNDTQSYCRYELEFENWEDFYEGENIIPLTFCDEAGNPSMQSQFVFTKDTIAPILTNPSESNNWIYCNEEPVYKLHNNLYGYYAIDKFNDSEDIQFLFQFTDSSIVEVQMELRYRKHFSEISFTMSDIDFPAKYFSPVISGAYHNFTLSPIKINATFWMVEIHPELRSIIENRECYIDVIAKDNADNAANFSLQIFDPPSGILNVWNTRLIFVCGAFLMLLGLMMFVISQFRPRKTFDIYNFGKLSEIDLSILDVALQPPDLEKVTKFKEYIKRFPNEIDLDRVTPYDLDDIINQPLQLVNLDEIMNLLQNFKMDPFQHEEFLREMLMLPLEERESFLNKYMTHKRHSND